MTEMHSGTESPQQNEKDSFDFSSTYSDNFPAILRGLNISLAVTSYQSQKLFFIRSSGDAIDVNFKSFIRPMGLAVSERQITLGTFKEILRFKRNDAVIEHFSDADKIDACFTPNVSHTTGMINIHDIAYGKEGLWVTNTAFSCLATIEPDYSFVPRWKPPFISELKPEDRCHLNGMAMLNGRPRYVTTFNKSDQPNRWREKRNDGTLIDVEHNRILLDGLSMPHSPRCYNGFVYFCESGKGLVHRLNPTTGELTQVAKLQGFTRGVDFYGPLMFVGLSKSRKSDVAAPAQINEEFSETYSGIWIINLEDHRVLGYVRFDGDVDQIYDIGVLTSMSYPELIEPDNQNVKHIFNFPPTLTKVSNHLAECGS